MDEHVVVIGYGTKGAAPSTRLVNNGLDKEAIVVVDPSTTALGEGARRRPGRGRPATRPGARCCGGQVSPVPPR